MNTDLEPPIPWPEEIEAANRRIRESVALWMWNDDYYENDLIWREVIVQVKEEGFFAWGL